MSILSHAAPNANATAEALDHAERFIPTAEEEAAYARWLAETDADHHDLDDSAPLELLDAEAPYGKPYPRYAIKATPGAWIVWDHDAGKAVATCSWLSEASDLMDLLVAEDSELVEVDDVPWWAGMPLDRDTIDFEIGLPSTDGDLA